MIYNILPALVYVQAQRALCRPLVLQHNDQKRFAANKYLLIANFWFNLLFTRPYWTFYFDWWCYQQRHILNSAIYKNSALNYERQGTIQSKSVSLGYEHVNKYLHIHRGSTIQVRDETTAIIHVKNYRCIQVLTKTSVVTFNSAYSGPWLHTFRTDSSRWAQYNTALKLPIFAKHGGFIIVKMISGRIKTCRITWRKN